MKVSVHVGPCHIGQAEIHNFRLKKLPNVRDDLTPNNKVKIWIDARKELQKVKLVYRKTFHKKLQPRAQPIKEIIVSGLANEQQIEKFCDKLREMGMTPLSYAIHNDEGHYDVMNGNWIPNDHTHIIVDVICWDKNKTISVTVRKKGKTVFGDDGKPEKKEVPAYARTLKLGREDMRKLQDLAAEALGLERGTPSSARHLDMILYKIKESQKDLEKLEVIKKTTIKEIKNSCSLLREQCKREIEKYDRARALILENKEAYSNKTKFLVLGNNKVRDAMEAVLEQHDSYKFLKEAFELYNNLILSIADLNTLINTGEYYFEEVVRLREENKKLQEKNFKLDIRITSLERKLENMKPQPQPKATLHL